MSPVYDETNYYENPQAAVQKEAVSKRGSPHGKCNFLPCVAVVVVSLLLLALCVIAALILAKISTTSQISDSTAEALGSDERHTSCVELLKHGRDKSGIYKIWSPLDGAIHGVYCDMETDGGGWSLVASVHRNEDGWKCNESDKWSYSPLTEAARIGGKGSKSWTDTSTMGSVQLATSSDYKGILYSEKASDVMLWHVPNDVRPDDYGDSAFLNYHTTNGFLQSYGSSLRNLFKYHAPLETLDIVGLDSKAVPLIQEGFRQLNLSNWFNYTFNSLTSAAYISEGGTHQIDIENKVFFCLNAESCTIIKYGKSYTDSRTFHLTSSAQSQPFLTMATVSSFDSYPSAFSIRVVTSYKGDGSRTVFTVSMNYKRYYAYARCHNIYYRTGKPSVAFVLFTLRSKDNNAAPGVVYTPRYPNLGSEQIYEMGVKSEVKNIILGYTLLTRASTNLLFGEPRISFDHVEKFLAAAIDALVSPGVQDSALKFPPKIVTRVKVAKGKISYSNHDVMPEWLQFRAYDKHGSPFAVCPGVKVGANADPAQFCIGSANTAYNNPQRCGDFSAWETLEDHVFVNRSLGNDGKFVNDLHSTVFIFTR